MKKILFSALVTFLIISCSNNDDSEISNIIDNDIIAVENCFLEYIQITEIEIPNEEQEVSELIIDKLKELNLGDIKSSTEAKIETTLSADSEVYLSEYINAETKSYANDYLTEGWYVDFSYFSNVQICCITYHVSIDGKLNLVNYHEC